MRPPMIRRWNILPGLGLMAAAIGIVEPLHADAPATQPATQPALQPAVAPPVVVPRGGAIRIGGKIVHVGRGVVGPPALPATEPTAEPAVTQALPADPAAIDAAISKLADPDWRKREKALSALIQMGEAAVPSLKKLEQTTQIDEVRNAAQTALRQIGENRIIGPSFVTLHLKNASPRQAFEALARQSFTALKPASADVWAQLGDMKVNIDVEREPFWVAMRSLSRQTGMELVTENGQAQLLPTGGISRTASRHGAVSGAFLIVPMQATLNRTVDFEQDDPPIEEDFSLELEAFPEPKLRVVHVSPTLKLLEAVDDKGNSLVPDPVPSVGAIEENDVSPAMGDNAINLTAALKRPKNIGSKLARLRGSVAFRVQLESRIIEVKDLKAMKDLPQMINGTRLVFNELKKEDDQYSLRVTLPINNENPGSFQEIQNSMNQRLRLLDAKGLPMESHGVSGGDGNGTTIQFTLNFGRSMQDNGQMSGEPVRLVWEIPTKTRDIDVQFELKDLKLP